MLISNIKLKIRKNSYFLYTFLVAVFVVCLLQHF